MAVNGIEIEVGQRWRMRNGGEAQVVENDGIDPFPFKTKDENTTYWVTAKGSYWNEGSTHRYDLVELLSQPTAGDAHQSATFDLSPSPDAEGWLKTSDVAIPFDADAIIEYRTRSGATAFRRADDLDFALRDDIIEFRVAGYATAVQSDAGVNETTEPGLAINPKDAIGSTKLPLHLWPNEATALGCIGMLEGMLKYGRNNFIAGNGVIASIYVDALYRHVKAWFEGEEITHDTKTDHLGNALACLGIMVKARAHGRLIDDRNYATLPNGERWREFVESLTPHVKRLQEMFADKSPRHFTIADVKFERKKADDTEGGEA